MEHIAKEVIIKEIESLKERYKANLKYRYKQKDNTTIKLYYIPDKKAQTKIKPILVKIREKEKVLIGNEKISYMPYLTYN